MIDINGILGFIFPYTILIICIIVFIKIDLNKINKKIKRLKR